MSSAESSERGVADATASYLQSVGCVKFVIADANDTSITILAVIAGFAKFCPIPPKSCFTITIATNEPTMHIHSGIDTGRL